MHTLGKCFGIESHILTAEEAVKVFPLLDPKSFTGALYSPGDGVVDPNMMCTALVKAASNNGGKTIENCPVKKILVGDDGYGNKKVKGVSTALGDIRTDCVVNATGVWVCIYFSTHRIHQIQSNFLKLIIYNEFQGRDLIEEHAIYLPLIPMKHAYIVSEPIEQVRGLPNVRDHDYSIYFRIQGESICMGGYESNPHLLDRVPSDFEFGLYDLDFSVFESHVNGAKGEYLRLI